MDAIYGLKLYFDQLVNESGTGMKALLMDDETIGIISSVFSQSDLLPREIYLFEKISTVSSKDPISFMKCVCLLRPNKENIDLLCAELKNPKFGQYYLCFTNMIGRDAIKRLAESDKNEVVKQIKEYYIDYCAINPHFFSLNIKTSCYLGSSNVWNHQAFDRTVSGLVAFLKSVKKNPTIRYQSSSDMCKRLAEGVKKSLNEGDLFIGNRIKSESSFLNKNVPPVLLIIDRKSDGFTPMLNQWSYQAMIHELMGINSNKINLKNLNRPTKYKEFILSSEQDDFYRENMFLNYNEIASNLKTSMEELKKKFRTIEIKKDKKLDTLDEVKTFCEHYPEFKKDYDSISKHFYLLEEIQKFIADNCIFEISEAEQELTCQNSHSDSLRQIRTLILKDQVRLIDALRLVMIYALRYENSSTEIQKLTQLLKNKGLSDDEAKQIKYLLNFAGVRAKTHTEFNELLSAERMKMFTKKMIKGLQNNVENVFLQHVCLLKTLLDDLIAGKLNPSHFPYAGTIPIERPREVIVFIIGGATCEESLAVYNLNKENLDSDLQIVLGSTCVHNFESFLNELKFANRHQMSQAQKS